ncbi:MAG: hypothetical protein ACLU9X_10515 [Alistipes shahii]
MFPVFNPSPDVVQLQIQAAGGIEFYKGQILYISRAGRNAYPLPLVDVVLTDMSTDEGLSNVNNRNVRNNFLTAGMLITKRGQGSRHGRRRQRRRIVRRRIYGGIRKAARRYEFA